MVEMGHILKWNSAWFQKSLIYLSTFWKVPGYNAWEADKFYLNQIIFYTFWDPDDTDFWHYEVFYTCVPLKPGDINLATWAYWIISSISFFPLWSRLYWWQKYVLVLTISLDIWMMDYRWKWYSKCISLNIKMNIILGYFARFPHFKIGWFRQPKNHNTVIICAFYWCKGLKCLAGSSSKKVF